MPSVTGVQTCADRKSTRLNSSHRCISYAVFCLKKKERASVWWVGSVFEALATFAGLLSARTRYVGWWWARGGRPVVPGQVYGMIRFFFLKQGGPPGSPPPPPAPRSPF